MKQKYYFLVDTCIICGNVVPEGRHVCPQCMEAEGLEFRCWINRPAIPAPSIWQRITSFFLSFIKFIWNASQVGTHSVYLEKQGGLATTVKLSAPVITTLLGEAAQWITSQFPC